MRLPAQNYVQVHVRVRLFLLLSITTELDHGPSTVAEQARRNLGQCLKSASVGEGLLVELVGSSAWFGTPGHLQRGYCIW